MREQQKIPENTDLTFSAQLTLAYQQTNNNMINEAINMYEVIISDENFANGKRLNVNLGNLFFRRKDYTSALKHYHKALDRVEPAQRRTRCKIMNNIGITQMKMNKYEFGRDNFAMCLQEEGEYVTALNLIIACYHLDDADSMKEAFQRLVDIPTLIDDGSAVKEQDVLVQEVLNNDKLKK